MAFRTRIAIYGIVAALVLALAVAWNWPVDGLEASVLEAVVKARGETDTVERRTALSDEGLGLAEYADLCFRKVRPPSSLVREFIQANRFHAALGRPFTRKTGVLTSSAHGPFVSISKLLIGEDPADCIDSGLTDHLQLSRVGISSDRQKALVFVEHHCALCGYGGFLLLEARNESWEIVDECVRWVS